MPDDLESLARDYYDFRQRTWPTWAHMNGEYGYADRFEDLSREAEDRQIAEARSFAHRAEAIADVDLDREQRISREMLAWDATARSDFAESRLAELDVDPIFGPQAMLPVTLPKLGIPSAEVAEAMVGKMQGIGRMFRDLAERHREGVARGRTPARFAVDATVAQLDAWLATPVDDDPLLALAAPDEVADPAAWRSRLRAAVDGRVRPAMAVYRDVLRDEIAPQGRPDDRCGLQWLADGADTYARTIRFYTTMPFAAQEIHDIGLAQVESLAREYRELGSEVLGTTDLPTILDSLRSDPELHHTDGGEIVAASKTALAKAKAAMGDWFGRLPKADCDVEEVQTGAIAYYFPPAKDGSRGGTFFMNTSEPTGWGRFQIEATAYHEGVPGHHLQFAIASELEGIPEFRTRTFLPAYGEGWGLYTERLADEMGLYSTPLDRLGMLSADSMRACRLVVDTGLHALGWSRRQAIDYMVENSPMRESHVTAEIDRYVVTPGQALAYMIGRLEIQRIRRDAEKALGDRFEIKSFHDAVLGSGALPLPLLERVVGERVASA
ncbi:MAG: DUF885 domain-containing protein [Candidatus Limnocylindrales bacterium]